MAFSVMVTDPFPTAFLPPFSLRRRIIGCVCASLAGSSRSVPFGTPFPLASWQSPHPIYPSRKVLFNCQRTGGKRSPHFYSQKKWHFRKKVMKIFFHFFMGAIFPLNYVGQKNGILETNFQNFLIRKNIPSIQLARKTAFSQPFFGKS